MTAKNEITKNASFYFFKHLTFAETALISAFMQRSLIHALHFLISYQMRFIHALIY